jgi:hypothetical protein
MAEIDAVLKATVMKRMTKKKLNALLRRKWIFGIPP